MHLVLVESPTKAKMLTKFLGDGYRVEATMGHVRDLPEKRLGVTITRSHGLVQIDPQYELVEKKSLRVRELRKAAQSASSVILATDPDREGEAIAFHVAELLKGKGTRNKPSSRAVRPRAHCRGAQAEGEQGTREFQRVVFHQITKDAILQAMKHPRGIDMDLVDAQQARRVLDRVVGYKLSPMLWKKIRRGLSAGRVQSVTVRLIVDREREIEAFVKVEYWDIWIEVKRKETAGKEEMFLLKLLEVDGKKVDLSTKHVVDPIISELEVSTLEVSAVEKKTMYRHPYPPFITSTIQQAGSRLFHWSSKKTMSVAQQLYEHGFITYHRTDSFSLDPGAIERAREEIISRFGPQFVAKSPNVYKTKSALAQEAHEAIRVTNVADIGRLRTIEQEVGAMGREAVKLYELVWKRFVATQAADQVYDQTSVSVEAHADGTKHYLLGAKGQVEVFPGWNIIYGKRQQSALDPAKEDQRLPEVTLGDELSKQRIFGQQHFTMPPARYSEAMLIKTLESLGIGRPSTYAPIVSTIQDRGYVEKKEGRFYPLPVGTVVSDFLLEHFHEIVDYDFTRGMEEDLDRIAQAKLKWSDVVGSFWLPLEDRLEQVEEKAARKKIPVEETGEPCPQCKEGMQVIRSGRFGKFLSCSRFPDCKWKDKLVEKLDMKCPECQTGEVVVKKTRKGKHFYGCSRYPECKWASWRKPK